jgi:hypothetical protein
MAQEWARRSDRRRRRSRVPVIARGDLRWFRFGAPDKRRPVLVLGRPDILPSLSQVPVIPLSTQARGLAWEVPLTDGVPTCVRRKAGMDPYCRARVPGTRSGPCRRRAGPRFVAPCSTFWGSTYRQSRSIRITRRYRRSAVATSRTSSDECRPYSVMATLLTCALVAARARMDAAKRASGLTRTAGVPSMGSAAGRSETLVVRAPSWRPVSVTI